MRKQTGNRIRISALAASIIAAIILAGCSQSTIAEVSKSEDAVSVLRDIATTQYFTEEAVDEAHIEIIVQAGINAPSAMNGQPWHFSVITDKSVTQQIADGMGAGMPFGMMPPDMTPPEGMTPPENETTAVARQSSSQSIPKAGISDAPLVIVVSCAAGSELDAGIVCQNMSATAQLLGYGSKIITSPTMALNGQEQDTYREILGIPQEYSAAAILLIGKTDTSVDPSTDGYTAATARNPINKLVTYINP